jgi:hypothetical protein
MWGETLQSFANVGWRKPWLVWWSHKLFTSWLIQGSEVVFLCMTLCSLRGCIYQCWLILIRHLLFQSEYLLMHIMVRLLTLTFFPCAVLPIAIFELLLAPLNKSFCHKTIPPTTMNMPTIASTHQLGDTLKGRIHFLRHTTLPVDLLKITCRH